MKLKFTLSLLFFISIAVFVNAQPPTHVPLMNNVWKLIAQRKYKKNEHFKMVPEFPPALHAFNNKEVEMDGYIIPLKADVELDNFMLAVVPYDQCPYCGQGDIPSMIEIKTKKPVRHTEKPVKIKGKLLLNVSGDKRSEIFVLDAEVIK